MWRFIEHGSLENVLKPMWLYAYKIQMLHDQNSSFILSKVDSYVRELTQKFWP